MKIIVGSEKKPKILSAAKSFAAAFPADEIEVSGVQTNSAVSSHPTSAEESLAGALNRVQHAKQLVPGADFYVGIEGGLLQVGDHAWELSYVVVMDSSGKSSTGLSAGIEIRGEILRQIRNGIELNDVLDLGFGIKSSGNANGFYGITTNDLVTRQSATEQAVLFALAPFLHPEFFAD